MAKAKRILVIGGAGYIGSHTHHELIRRGHEVIVYDNFSTGFRESVHANAFLLEGDILDEARLRSVVDRHPPDAVIHFAASIEVEESVRKPLDYYWNNTAGTMSVLRALRVAGCRAPFILSSTAAVYGEADSRRASESTPTAPINPYGWSKLFSERVLLDHSGTFDLPFVILRYFNVAGAREDGSIGLRSRNATHLIKMACEVALGRRPELAIFGTDYPTPDGTGVRDYIHVDDLADAHVASLDYLWSGGKSDIFNCGYGRGSSVLEVVRAFEKILGRPLPHRFEGRRSGDPAALVADASRIQKAMGWKPHRQELETICRSALEWEKRLG